VADSGQRRYAGKTGAQRVALRRKTLIDAAIAAVDQSGWRQLTVDRVCTEAGLIRRYFYESFTDVDALAAAVIDELATEILQVVVADDLGKPASELIHTMVHAMVDYAMSHRPRARVFFGELAATDTASQRRLTAVRRIVDFLVAEARTIHHAEDSPVIDLSASLLVNGSAGALLDWLDGHIDIPQEQFVDELSAIWVTLTDAAIARLGSVRGAGRSR
jgi:AcrR family transcriptional regulator